MQTSLARIVARWVTAGALLATLVLVYRNLLQVNPTTVALTFLLLIQWLAAYWGLALAAFASGAAALCFNYFFLPPIDHFSIADTQNWLALAAFLVAALIGSNLANRLQAARAASDRRGRELEQLYDFGQRLLGAENTAELLRTLPFGIVAAFACADAAVYLMDTGQVHASFRISPVELASLQAAASASIPAAGPTPGSMLVPVSVGVRPAGAIYLAMEPVVTSASAQQPQRSGISSLYAELLTRLIARPTVAGLPSIETMEAMGSLVALSLARAAAAEKLVHAEAEAESDRLRATLLDAVTHDLRTPLTSIKASVTSLLSQSSLRADQREELLTVIDEESDRLNHLIGQAVEMAQLDAKALRLDQRAYPLVPLLEEVLETAQARWADRAIGLQVIGEVGEALIDPALIAKVLLHLLENAAKYSTPGGPVTVSATRQGRSIEIAVADRGPGIPPLEQERIFDKFYRNPAQRYRVQGTGMGLAIARAIVEEHGGALTVESLRGEGSTFRFTLPRTS